MVSVIGRSQGAPVAAALVAPGPAIPKQARHAARSKQDTLGLHVTFLAAVRRARLARLVSQAGANHNRVQDVAH